MHHNTFWQLYPPNVTMHYIRNHPLKQHSGGD